MEAGQEFFNLYNHDFARVAIGVPRVQVADPAFNSVQIIELMEQAVAQRAIVALFPELGISAYSCDDLFHQRALLDSVQHGLQRVLDASERLPLVAVVGLPIQIEHLLFNCAAVVYRGRVLGVVPKTYLPNYREFYEARQFTPHVTLGRARHEGGPMDALAALLTKKADWQAGEVSVREVLVMSSELTPQGPVYSILSRAKLGSP